MNYRRCRPSARRDARREPAGLILPQRKERGVGICPCCFSFSFSVYINNQYGASKKAVAHGPAAVIGDRMKRVNIILSDKDLERASKIGEGNVSAGIRLALERAVYGLKPSKQKRR